MVPRALLECVGHKFVVAPTAQLECIGYKSVVVPTAQLESVRVSICLAWCLMSGCTSQIKILYFFLDKVILAVIVQLTNPRAAY